MNEDLTKLMNSKLIEHFKREVELLLDATIETFKIVIAKKEIKDLDIEIESAALQIQMEKLLEVISGKKNRTQANIDMEIENNKAKLVDSFTQDLIELLLKSQNIKEDEA